MKTFANIQSRGGDADRMGGEGSSRAQCGAEETHTGLVGEEQMDFRWRGLKGTEKYFGCGESRVG